MYGLPTEAPWPPDQICWFDMGDTLCQMVILGGTRAFLVLACPLNPLWFISPHYVSPSHCRYLDPVCSCNMLAVILRCQTEEESCLCTSTGTVCRGGASAPPALRSNFRMTWMVIVAWMTMMHLCFDEIALTASSSICQARACNMP